MLVILLIATTCLSHRASASPATRKRLPLERTPSASNDHFQWKLENGVFKFGMQGDDQWRVETRHPDGSVFVRYAYRAPDGQVIESSFTRGRQQDGVERIVEDQLLKAKLIGFTAPALKSGSNNNDVKVKDGFGLAIARKDMMPYGALSSRFHRDDFVETNNIVDFATDAIVIQLN